MLNICDVLHNKAKIVHLDVKPDNMIYSRGRLYMLDFGLSQSISAIQQKHQKKCKINCDQNVNFKGFQLHFIKQNETDDFLKPLICAERTSFLLCLLYFCMRKDEFGDVRVLEEVAFQLVALDCVGLLQRF